MKRQRIVLFVMILTLCLSGCTNDINKPMLTASLQDSQIDESQMNQVTGVTLQAEASPYPEGTEKIVIQKANRSSYYVLYNDYAYWIEVFQDGKWMLILTDRLVREPLVIWAPGTTDKQTIDLSAFATDFPAGLYRVYWEVEYTIDSEGYGDRTEGWISAEFEIDNNPIQNR